MRYRETGLPGCLVVEPELIEDERGFFARTWDAGEMGGSGLNIVVVQCNISFNKRRGTLRGLHYQSRPHEEAKLVRCTRGAIYDVAVDVRPGSPTFGSWVGEELTAENRLALYVPEGFAHGYQTLVDATEVSYQVSHRYVPEASRGVLWSDPAIGIDWPVGEVTVSDRDRSQPSLAEAFA